MVSYELWIDESGNFMKDGGEKDSPSLVGGVLTISHPNNFNIAKDLVGSLRKKYEVGVHATEITDKKVYGEYATELLTKVQEQGWSLVIFENKERLEIVDGDRTYLNVLAEGVVQLYQTLMLTDEEVKLDILISRRVKGSESTKDYKAMIKNEEYKAIFAEKLIMASIRNSLTQLSKNLPRISIGSAKDDPPLQIADCVCHSWFRKDKKFTAQQQKQLDSLFKPRYYYSVIENDSWSNISRLLRIGSIGNAVFEWLVLDKDQGKKIHQKFIEELKVKLNFLPDLTKEIELKILVEKLGVLLKVERDLHKVEIFLSKIHRDILPLFDSEKFSQSHYDLLAIELRLLNHQGSVLKAQNVIDKINNCMPKLASRWESFQTYFDFKIIEAVNHMNLFAYHKVIDDMEQLEEIVDETLGLFPAIPGIADVCSEIKSDIKAKIHGNLLQAQTALIREDADQYSYAMENSKAAISEFAKKGEILRQYSYRSMLECEAHNFTEAYNWLAKAVDLEPGKVKLEEVLGKIKKDKGNFLLMHYVRLMAESSNFKNPLADEMYKKWIDLKIDEDYLASNKSTEHPYQIIYWKLATFLSNKGSIKAAVTKYDEAISIAYHDSNRLTILAIGLAVELEKASILLKAGDKFDKEAQKAIKGAIKSYNAFIKMEMPKYMRDYFSSWEEEIQKVSVLDKEKQAEQLLKLSRRVCY